MIFKNIPKEYKNNGLNQFTYQEIKLMLGTVDLTLINSKSEEIAETKKSKENTFYDGNRNIQINYYNEIDIFIDNNIEFDNMLKSYIFKEYDENKNYIKDTYVR